MSTILSGTNSANRLVEVLAGSTALLADPAAASTGVAPLSAVLSDGDTPADAGADGGQPVATDALLSDVPLQGLSSLDSGTLGLDGVLGGGAGSVGEAGILHDISQILSLDDIGGSQGSGLDLAGSGTPTQPVFDVANTAIQDVHFEVEALGDELGLPAVVHGVTTLGDTVGLGEIGRAPAADGHTNLITDILNAPDSVLDGDLSCTWFRRHRVRCFNGAGGVQWNGSVIPASSSLRL